MVGPFRVQRGRWEVVVEPDEELTVLVVVTAYTVDSE